MPSVKAKLPDPLKSQTLPTSGVVGWRKLGPLLKRLASGLTMQVSVEGGHVQTIDGGVHLKLPSTDEGQMRRITVNFGGAPAERWVWCSRAFTEEAGVITWLE